MHPAYDHQVHVPLDVSSWEVVQLEVDGSTDNVWLRDSDSGLRWLFKPATDSPITDQGRDWAEWIVAQIAMRLGVPAAEVSMATRDGVPGSLTRHLIDDPRSGQQLQPGAVLLSQEIEGYVGYDPDNLRANRQGHSLDNIQFALRDIACPPGWVGGLSSFECFVAYLVLDALVANTDRHARNWGLLVTPGDVTRLAPSYDHGSSLGFGLPGPQREHWLAEGVKGWAQRGRAAQFDQGRKLTLLDLVVEAFGMVPSTCSAAWGVTLSDLELAEIIDVVAAAARMSGVERRFATEVIEVNRRRLLHVCADA